jgi:hypothetical protein
MFSYAKETPIIQQIKGQIEWLKMDNVLQKLVSGRMYPTFPISVLRKILRPETKKVIINLSR